MEKDRTIAIKKITGLIDAQFELFEEYHLGFELTMEEQRDILKFLLNEIEERIRDAEEDDAKYQNPPNNAS